MRSKSTIPWELSTTFLLLVGLLSSSLPASAQISLVHVTSCGSPGTTCTIPSTGSGNLLVIGWAAHGGEGAATIASVTDNAGNTYSECPGSRAVDANANDMGDVWYAENSIAGATAVTITPNPSSATGTAVIWEYSGVAAYSPLDQTGVLNSQPATTTPSGAPLTTAVSNELIISIGWVQGAVSSILSGNPFTNDSTATEDGWAHYIASTPGTYSAQWNSNLGTYGSSSVSFRPAAVGGSACDLNKDGAVNVIDVQLATNMDLGLLACPADINGGVCDPAFVQQIVTAALGQGCFAATNHSVSLTWTASTSAGVAGYNVYRSTTSGGPYTQLNTSLVTVTTFVDATVKSGQTYYYVTTAVDTSNDQSVYSNQAVALVPTP
jgi:hypothetical protein